MALTDSSPESFSDGPGAAQLATVHDLHPPKEGAFDSGTHHFFQGEVKVGRDTVLYTLEIPENLAYDGLAIFVPGYSGIKGSSRGPRGAMANEGFAIATYSPARRGDSWYETAAKPQKLHSKSIRAVGKAVAQSGIVKQEAPNFQAIDFEKKLLLAHSMGGLGAAEYATYEPGSVDAVFELAACGFGHPTLKELAQDIPKGAHLGLWHEVIPSLLKGDIAMSARNARDFLQYFVHVRAIIEGNSCLREDSREKIAALRDKGIFFAYEAFQNDILVRADPGVAEHVDYHETMAGAGHLAPIRKSSRVARRVADVILSR